MTDAYWCVLISALMPYVWVMISKRRKGYDNSAPRAGTGQLQPLQQRAYWAHENAFEAFGPFAAAVIIASGQCRSMRSYFRDCSLGLWLRLSC
jgi:uncharacterized MAPEG superfamily protein